LASIPKSNENRISQKSRTPCIDETPTSSQNQIGQPREGVSIVQKFYMNKSPLMTVLLALVTASALASVVLCWGYISNMRELPTAHAQATMVNNNRALINALANDVRNYSKDNPAIVPLLEATIPKAPKPVPAATPKPAGK
jgi:hypothetical protein